MTQESFYTVAAAAVAISTIAILAMAGMMFGMFKAIRTLQERVNVFLPRAEGFIASSQSALNEHGAELREITQRARTVLDSTQKQLSVVDGVLGDAAIRARTQLERLELVVDDTVKRVHSTVVKLDDTVTRPVKEINALGAGIRAAAQTFLRGQRPSVAQATSDEEMFI